MPDLVKSLRFGLDLGHMYSWGGLVLSRDYRAWNQVLFEKFYSMRSAGLPVYLDLEDSLLEVFETHPLLAGKGTVGDLVNAVRENIDFSLNKDQVFLKIENETHSWINTFWRTHGDEIPPMLPLLALTVLAAERMGGDGSASNAYYKHFNDILGIDNPKQQESVQESYRKTVIFLWKALNRWLTDRQGQNGEYTAYSLSYAHIGAAMSQALIRDVDRKKLPKMFEYLRLEPGSQVSIPDMKELFSVWLKKDESGVTQSLRNLWAKDSARNGIAEVLCSELSKWDGASAAKSSFGTSDFSAVHLPSKLRVTLRQSSKLMQKRYEFGLGFNPSNSLDIGSFEASLVENSEVSATCIRRSVNLATLIFNQTFKSENLLEGKIDLLASSGDTLKRLPRNLVLLARDDDSGIWVEVDRAALGQELILLVRLDSNAWQSLLTFLNENARPGFEFATPGSLGLPTGWGLIEYVQIVDIGKITSATEDLRALVPVSGSQLAFRGGLRLPSSGSFKYWLASKPPIVEAVGQPGTSLKLEVHQLNLEADKLVGSASSSLGILSFDLETHVDDPGNYRVTLFEGKTAIAQREFYLRDSSQPDLIASRSKPRLGHSTRQSPFEFVTSAIELQDEDLEFTSGLLNLVQTRFELGEDQGSFGTKSSWLPDELATTTAPIQSVFPVLDSSSCAFTGKHHWELGTCIGNAKYVLGVCKACGDQKLQMCSAYLAQRAKELNSRATASQDLSTGTKVSVSPVIKRETISLFDWKTAFEILNYCVHGTVSSLVAALDQLATDKISAIQALTILESRGALEIVRDALGKPIRWSLPEKSLQLKEDLKLHFHGFWNRADLREVSAMTGDVFRHTTAGMTPDLFSQLSDDLQVDLLAPEIFKYLTKFPLWRSMPDLSAVREDAPRQVLQGFEKFDQLDLESGKWVESKALRPRPGAFRAYTKTGLRYFYANAKDLSNGKAVSNSSTLVKWFAANEHGVELLAYSEEDEALYVPLGAQLPPFYARVLAEYTCVLPRTVTTKSGKSLTKYQNVPTHIASTLRSALTN
jgi:hypothetical protein